VDKLVAASKAKAVFVAEDPNVTKGPGMDVETISATFEATYENAAAAGGFAIPPGSANGWVVNKPKVAKFVNKSAPAGPTQAKVAV
jgi:hypothetical protein